MSNDSNELRNLPVSPRPSNPYQWQHSELKIMKAFRRMNTDRGYNEPKLRHETIQTPEGGEMYVAEVDVYLQWRVKRTVRGEPQNTIKAASLDVAEKATAYLMDMLHGTKHMGAKNTKHQLQSEQANIGMNSGDRSSTLPAANAVGCKKEEDKSASTAPEEVVSISEETQNSVANFITDPGC